MSYYYRVSADEVHGPVDFPTLLTWTTAGQLDPRTEIGNSAEGPWAAAQNIEQLGMDWLVPASETAHQIGPLHPLAMAILLEDETIEPDTEITQVSTGESYQAVDVLCAVLLEQRSELQEQLATAQQPPAAEAPSEPATASEPSSDLEAHIIALQQENDGLKKQIIQTADDHDVPDQLPEKLEWREVMRAKDLFGKEAEKWKKFYDDEADRSKKNYETMSEQIRVLKENDLDTGHRISVLEKKRRILEEKNFELQEAIARGDAPTNETDPMEMLNLKRSYNELHDKFELILDQLKDRTDQLESLYEQRDEIELDARRQQDEMHVAIQKERDEAQKSRRQLIDLESSHRDLLLAYRDLNDRIVRDRNNPNAGLKQTRPNPPSSGNSEAPTKKTGNAAEKKAAAKEAKRTAKAKDKGRSKKSGAGKPRLKLT